MSTHQVIEFYPGFNREVVPVVFSVEGAGFRIDAALLTAHSAFFSDMLASPDIGLDGEGTETHPIVVNETTKSQFANFCRWLTHKSWSNLEATEGELIDVLHVSHLFQVLDGVKFAVHALDSLSNPPLSLCRRLRLTIRYGITSWVNTTVHALLHKPADTYNADDLAYIGIEALSIIFSAKEKITTLRADISNFPIQPTTTTQLDEAPFCKDHVKCRRIWVERWFTHLSRRIHCPSRRIALADVPISLEEISHHGMNPECKNYHLSLVRLSPELQKEDILIDTAVRQIRALIETPGYEIAL